MLLNTSYLLTHSLYLLTYLLISVVSFHHAANDPAVKNYSGQCDLLLARLMGQYCFAHWRLSASVFCRRCLSVVVCRL